MKIRSFKAIFFILIFLTSKIGVAFNVHYCGGHIHEIALAWNAEGCGMSVKKSQDSHPGSKPSINHCCQDKTVFIQNNEPQKTTDSELQTNYFAIPQSNTCNLNLPKIIFPKAVFAKPKSLVLKEKIFLLNHSLIFYG